MPPNILFLLIDDLGWRDLSCYGSSFYETPNLDRLAAGGVRCTEAYAASPVCSPTRAALMSGKHPARVGVTQYIGGHAVGKLCDVPYYHALPASEICVAEALRRGGYATWHVGKWHLGEKTTWPERHGFDVNIAGCGWGLPRGGYFSPYQCPTLSDGPPGEYLTDRLTDEATQLIRERDTARPFFLNLWHYAVHTPIQAPREVVEKYERKAKALGLDERTAIVDGERFTAQHIRHDRVRRRVIQSDPAYAAMVENLDTNIGRLLDALEAEGLAEETLVVFTSDNGGLSTAEGSPTCNHPLAEGKGWLQEGGTRVCQIARWPGRIAPGSESAAPMVSMDWYPTWLEAAGLPPMPTQHVDGRSLVPALTGESHDLAHRDLFFHYPHYSNQGGGPGCALRSGDWKLVEYFEDGRATLHHLRDDLGEERDLAAEEPARVEEMRRRLAQWRAETEALIPRPNPNYLPPPLDPEVDPAVV